MPNSKAARGIGRYSLLASTVLILEKRYEEDKRKSKAVVQNIIGDNVKDMMYVNGICTSPASQGRGYGGAVLDSVTAIVSYSQQFTCTK
jgi:hypothetical protein